MSGVTVKQLADKIGIEIDRLLSQLGDAGITAGGPDDKISDSDKQQLLDFLRKSHGKDGETENQPKKITLKRKTKSQLVQSNPSQRRSKSVNVEVRKKRTYVKRSEASEGNDDVLKEAEAAKKALQVQAEQEAEVKLQKEKKAQEEADKTAKLENDAAEKVAELARVEEAGITPEPKAETVAAETVSSVEPVVETKPEPVDVKPEVSTEKKKEKHFKAAPPAAKKPDEKEKRRVPEGKPKPKQKGRKNYFVEDDGSKSRGAKRKKKKLKVAAASEHQFEKPTKPVTKEIAVPEAITVSELAQRMSIKAAEVIKKLMTMGTMATINHVLDQDTAMLVTEELGHVAVVQVDNCAEQKLFDDADSGQKVPRA
ncbi:MAG: translation initiation factor IF-2, partial [Methylococcales bacterium]|nr:translation initiation factor IF-2 [Methylococcales bacterium]